MADPPVMWMMDSASFMDALKRVADGDTPDNVFMECYANAFVGNLGIADFEGDE